MLTLCCALVLMRVDRDFFVPALLSPYMYVHVRTVLLRSKAHVLLSEYKHIFDYKQAHLVIEQNSTNKFRYQKLF